MSEPTAIGQEAILRRCFAYNIDGQRCGQLAGHEGNHAIVMEWTDDECFEPGRTYVGGTPVTASDLPAPFSDQIAEPTVTVVEKCVMCNHPESTHGEGGCTARQKLEDGYADGDACGCYTFV